MLICVNIWRHEYLFHDAIHLYNYIVTEKLQKFNNENTWKIRRPNLSIKILGVNFGNVTLDNSIWDKISENINNKKTIHLWNRVTLSLRGRKLIIDQILLSKLWYICQTYIIPKYIKKEIEKRIYEFLWEGKKIHPHRHLLQLPIWKGGLGILNIDTQLNSLKVKWIQRLLHPTNALWKDLMLLWLNLILNSNYGLSLFRQNKILQPIPHKNFQKYINDDFFILLLNAWLHFTNNDFPTPASIEEILDQLLFLNPRTKSDFRSKQSLSLLYSS